MKSIQQATNDQYLGTRPGQGLGGKRRLVRWASLGAGALALGILSAGAAAAQNFEADVRPVETLTSGPGGALAVHGQWAVLGGEGGPSSGFDATLQRYDPQTQRWTVDRVLVPTGSPLLSSFGSAVDIGEQLLVVGDPYYGFGFPEDGDAFGWYLDPASQTWLETPPLRPAQLPAGGFFGWSVAVDGLQVLVGSYTAPQGGLPESGAAYLFRFDPGAWAWSLQDTLSPAAPVANMAFGRDVALDGSTAWVASSGSFSNPLTAVHVFRRLSNGTTWTESQVLPSPGGSGLPRIDLDGTLGALAAGGQAWVLRKDAAGNFQYEVELSALTTRVPVEVAVSQGRVAAGAPFDGEAGLALVFAQPACGGGTWQQTAELSTIHKHQPSTSPRFGSALDWDGERLMAGMPNYREPGSLASSQKGGASTFSLSSDCDNNGVDDSCDIAAGAADLDGDGILDACEAVGSRYCSPNVPNSTGEAAFLLLQGRDDVASNRFVFSMGNLPQGQFGIFLVSRSAGFLPGAGGAAGNLCLGAGIGRVLPLPFFYSSESDGFIHWPGDLEAMPLNPTVPVQAGESLFFQGWYRDGSTSNFSDAVRVSFR